LTYKLKYAIHVLEQKINLKSTNLLPLTWSIRGTYLSFIFKNIVAGKTYNSPRGIEHKKCFAKPNHFWLGCNRKTL
jgi:hypothetical protein